MIAGLRFFFHITNSANAIARLCGHALDHAVILESMVEGALGHRAGGPRNIRAHYANVSRYLGPMETNRAWRAARCLPARSSAPAPFVHKLYLSVRSTGLHGVRKHASPPPPIRYLGLDNSQVFGSHQSILAAGAQDIVAFTQIAYCIETFYGFELRIVCTNPVVYGIRSLLGKATWLCKFTQVYRILASWV